MAKQTVKILSKNTPKSWRLMNLIDKSRAASAPSVCAPGRCVTVKDYYLHARSLGAFSAEDCLRMARQAVALDDVRREAREAQETARRPGPSAVCWEYMPDGSAPVRLGFSIKVY